LQSCKYNKGWIGEEVRGEDGATHSVQLNCGKPEIPHAHREEVRLTTTIRATKPAAAVSGIPIPREALSPR